MEYVDVIFAHRCDISGLYCLSLWHIPLLMHQIVPMEEIVRAFNYVINQGWAFYWATSEWTAVQIEEAFRKSVHYL